jgi:hypothetical protein
MFRLVATAAVCILTAGCLSDQQFAAQIPVSDDVACQSYGALPGSQAYFNCRVAKNQQRQVVTVAIAAALSSQPPLAKVVHDGFAF